MVLCSSAVMATKRVERTTDDTDAAVTLGEEVREVSIGGNVQGLTAAAEETVGSLSLSACTSSLSNSDRTLKVGS